MSEKQNNRWCCRIFPIFIILISMILTAGIWYFEKGDHSLSFLDSWRELIHFIGSVFFVAVFPIGLFYYLNEREQFQNRARLLAFLGFIPALLFLVFIIL